MATTATMPLTRVIIYVGDVERCAKFYGDVFGFKVMPQTYTAGEWAELDTGACRVAFHKAYGQGGVPIGKPTGSTQNPHKIVFFAEDVPAKRDELIARGAKMGEVMTFDMVVLCDGQDVEGHVFQICNRP